MKSMMIRAFRHLRTQWAGMLALFLLLTSGTAYALAGKNTVFSDDIVDGQVRARDLADRSIGSRKLIDGSVLGLDLKDGTVTGIDVRNESLAGSDIKDGTVTGADVGADSLSGVQIDESGLQRVPSAAQGGIGRTGEADACNPSGSPSTSSARPLW